MAGPAERIEIIARAMCRSAGFDPDELIETDAHHTRWHSMQPAKEQIEAWRRYQIAAENFCAVSRDLLEVDRRH
jgi:hypothetical protein